MIAVRLSRLDWMDWIACAFLSTDGASASAAVGVKGLLGALLLTGRPRPAMVTTWRDRVKWGSNTANNNKKQGCKFFCHSNRVTMKIFEWGIFQVEIRQVKIIKARGGG